MKKLLAIALLLSFNHSFAQSTGDQRTSYWNGSLWSSGTFTGTGTQILLKGSGAPQSAVVGPTLNLSSGTLAVASGAFIAANSGTGSNITLTGTTGADLIQSGDFGMNFGTGGVVGLWVFESGLSAGENNIINVSDPFSPQDAATKNYVDTKTVPSTRLAGTGTLTVTGAASISGTTSGLNTGDQTASSIGAIATLNGSGTNLTITGTAILSTSGATNVTLNRTDSGTATVYNEIRTPGIVSVGGTLLLVQPSGTTSMGTAGSIFRAITSAGQGFRVSETGAVFITTPSLSITGGPAVVNLGGSNNSNTFTSGNSGSDAATDFIFQAGTADRTSGKLFQIKNNTNVVLSVSATTGGGRIGVGTATPAQPLDVVGNIAASGNMIVGGTLVLSGTTAAPTNTITPVAWCDTVISGTTFKVPLYQ